MTTEFQRRHTLEHRRNEATRIMQLYPGRIPIIVERSNRNTDLPPIKKSKFLAPIDFTVGQFIYVLRKNMSLTPDKALFVFISGSLPASSTLIRELYNDYKDDDGFLYILYSGESTFGMGDVPSPKPPRLLIQTPSFTDPNPLIY